jgi:tyrosyl-tRNA synthetase
MIGDPSGKSAERTFLSDDVVARNADALRKQLSRFLGGVDFEMVNNAEWLHKINLMEFLRDIGKNFTINEMVKRDNIRPRLETEGASISYTEFTYSLLQAYDFLHLHEKKKCDLQIGGSDQWGNIVSGVDLIRRKTEDTAHAFTWPLLIDKKTGKKFGKSEGGAVWLDAAKTSPFAFYQFWFNVEDDAAEDFLLKMTLLSVSEIADIMKKHRADPGMRHAQSELARNITGLVHGEEVARTAEAVSGILFGGADIAQTTEKERNMLMKDAPSVVVALGDDLVDVLVGSGLAPSKREAREFIKKEAISVNGKSVTDPAYVFVKSDFTHRIAFLKRGKRHMSVLVLSQ